MPDFGAAFGIPLAAKDVYMNDKGKPIYYYDYLLSKLGTALDFDTYAKAYEKILYRWGCTDKQTYKNKQGYNGYGYYNEAANQFIFFEITTINGVRYATVSITPAS